MVSRGHKSISLWTKIYLLLWKDVKILSSNKIGLVIQLVTPLLFCGILLAMRASSKPITIDRKTEYMPLPVPHTNYTNFDDIAMTLIFTPPTILTRHIMEHVSRTMKLTEPLVEVGNLVDLYSYWEMPNVKQPIAGVVFSGNVVDANNSTNFQNVTSLNVTVLFPAELRNPSSGASPANWVTDLQFPLFDSSGLRNLFIPDGGSPPGYYREHFTTLQHAISTAFIMAKGNLTEMELPAVYIQRFPDPPISIDKLHQIIKLMLPLVFFLTFLYPCFTTVKVITMEKELQLKEAMKIMGLPNWLHWIAWLINIMCFMIFTIVGILVLLTIRWSNDIAVFTHSNPLPMFVFLIIYSFSVSCYCFLMSVIFNKANTAATVAGFIWFIYLVPYFMTEPNYSQFTYWQKMLICFFQNTGLSYGFLLILTLEGNLEGLQWKNYSKPVSVDDDLSVGSISMMMLISATVHMIIALYIEQVMPGEFGVPKVWYFPVERLVKLLWRRKREKSVESTQNWKYVEYVHETKPPGIEIKKLRKTFDEDRVAVQGLSLKMYPDEITVFLGENGAGKTTTMSMLTGMLLPTSGTATINGCDILKDIDCVRSSIGYCPQHNILFDELTVGDHIYFYSTLKGLNAKEAHKEVDKYVSLLELKKKVNAKAKTLPGGMKRRLSVVVAFCGGSKVVLCDEPTSGMDPSARRAMWDLLQLEKSGRTIMLSTQFMDEADVLGDRVAIMKAGQLVCYGSAMYLKSNFASGYLLFIEKDLFCDVSRITRMIASFIPSVSVDRDVGTELTYRLQSSYVHLFEPMLKELETKSYYLNVRSYGIAQTRLEDVFMQIVKTHSSEELRMDRMARIQKPQGVHKTVQGVDLIVCQLLAMLYKRFFIACRNWMLILIQNTIPIALTSITIHIARMIKINKFLPPLLITLNSYENNPISLLSVGKEVQSNRMTELENQYRGIFSESVEPRTIRDVESIPDFVLGLSLPEFVAFKNRGIVGLQLKNDSVIAWFNNVAYHSVAQSLDLYYNALLDTVCRNCDISFVNAPMRFTAASRLAMHNSVRDFGFQLAANVGFAMSFVSSFYVIFYIKERVSRAKLLQIVSGANLWTYWLTSWAFDFVQFLFTTLLIMLTLYAYAEEGWNTVPDLARMFVLFVSFIWAILPFIYLCSFMVDVPSSGLIVTIMFGVFMGNAIFYVVYAFEFPSLDLVEEGKLLTWIMMSIPQFAVMHGLKNLDKMNSYIPICEDACYLEKLCDVPEDMCHSNVSFSESCCVLDYFAWASPGIGRNMAFQLNTGCVLFVILFLIEFEVPQRLYRNSLLYQRYLKKRPQKKERNFWEVDSDVLQENRKISQFGHNQIRGYNLVLNKMTKYYGTFLAVNGLSLAVAPRECFGLLGINGAGKTTTFKMLIGDEWFDSGEAWVCGYSLSHNMRTVYQNIGYCPQFDALFDELTGEETLKVYCLLRGIPKEWIKYVTMKMAHDLNFVKHLGKLSSQYSGGNKRKLSTAIALLGRPAVVYLDEPTTGMDPGAKRHLWHVLTKYRMKGRSIVLTSHSMEECDALCTRLAIMVNGEFQCIGTAQHLKYKFAKSYLLVILMRQNVRYGLTRDAINIMMSVREFVEYQFDGARLKENYQGRLTFHIPMTGMKWSEMFGIMEKYKGRLQIENYSLSQATLEEVFLSFTKYQKEQGG